jgi:hypothetical protein
MLIKNSKKTTVVSSKTAVRRAQKAQPSIVPAMAKGSWKESRPEAVARARKLLKDPNYPSAKVMNSVAKLLARHLT